jgi:cell wall-associated NlpC family hydrolase
MAVRNQLFFIILTPIVVNGCGTLTTGRDLPVAPAGAERTAAPVAAPSALSTTPARETDMLFHALMASGVDYRRGGKSYQSGFDCSGLVAHVYREAYGLALPHSTQAQSELGEAIGLPELEAGDLVFFNTQRKPFSHVGIYIGDGRFIHAPKEGAVVRTENLHARYWATRFNGARRIVPPVVTADYPGPGRKPVVTYP